MELKNIFKMTKTDRYTQDGRDELAKLQETEDVTYKTGDISQKTGLQKQPDGSWAPPKGGAKKPAGKKDAAKPTTEELNTLKDIMREYRKNPNKQTEQIMNEAKSHLMKNRGMTPEQLGKLGREVMAETNKPATQKAISPDDVVTSLDEMEKTKAKTTKNIGGVKVQFDPQTGYKITHKAPTGKEITTGYNNLEEAHQAVMFRLNRIKNGEIPAISEDAAPKIRQLTGDCKIKIRPETQDVRYKIGDISQKTGLQKTANGWVKPKTGNTAAAGSTETKQEYKGPTNPDHDEILQKMKSAEGYGHVKTIGDYEVYRVTSGPEKGKYKVSLKGSNEEMTMSENQAAKYLLNQKRLNERSSQTESKPTGNKPDKVGDFMKAYERGEFGKFQQNAEQRKVNSFFNSNKDSAPRVLTGDTRIRVKK